MDNPGVAATAAPLWERTRRNGDIKLWACGAALLLWAHVKTDQFYEVQVPLPIKVIESTGQFLTISPLPPEALVRFRGTGKQLLFQTFSQTVILRPNITQIGQIRVALSVGDIDDPDQSQVQPVEIISPRSLELEFDFAAERLVPVIPTLNLDVLPGYTRVGQVSVEPGSVLVRGPRGAVLALQSIGTDTIAQSELEAPLERRAALLIPKGVNLTLTPEKVDVRVEIQGMLERRISGIPIRVRYLRGRKVSVQPSMCSVDVVGGSEWIAGLTANDFRAVIDYRRRRREGTRRLMPEIFPPPDVQVVGVVPETVLLVESDE